ncbi:MAG: hypothetical protein U0414_32510 [Polyangiaceae bacterium]
MDGLDCMTGLCADGFCCDRACGGPCEACAAAQTGIANGMCAATPNADCPGTCSEGTETAAGKCDAMGKCVGTEKKCAPFTCAQTVCKTSCTVGAVDCDATTFCWIGGCTKLAQISALYSHTCAVTDDGAVQCWGRNAYGEVGDGSTTKRLVPVAVTGLSSGIASVGAGGGHSCALTTMGGVKCWGHGSFGELGDNLASASLAPVAVSGLASGVTAIAVGGAHNCALTTGGGVKCWGLNDRGQLGNNSTAQSNVPVGVSGLSSGVIAIAASLNHTCALTAAGAVKCWGDNDYGALGNGTTTASSVPVSVTGLSSGVTAIAAGFTHTCALTSAGGVKCWGHNIVGELGDGSATSSSVPVGVSGLASGVAAIAAGHETTCARTSAGAALCWGANWEGALGNDSRMNSPVPIGVTGLSSGVAAITTGSDYGCALTMEGRALCWGRGIDGQLGNDSMTASPIPVGVVEP